MRRRSVVTYREHLVATLRRAQVPLIAGAILPVVGSFVLLLVMFGISASRAPSPELVQEIVREVGREISRGFPYRALFFAARTYLVALGAVAVYGAPAYALLARMGRANWLTAALVGIAPGLAAFLVGIYPSGRLANANYTVGPMVMLCGVFVALATHALMLDSASEAPTRAAAQRSTLRRLSRVFVLAAILGQTWTLFVTHTPPGQDFGALQVVGDIAAYVAPFLLAAFACALYSYHLTPRPRGAAPIVEIVVMLGVGAALLEPAVRVLGMI